MLSLSATAATIALVGFMEAISIAKGVASQTKQGISANQELVGQGLANVVAGFFSGYAVSGSFSRTAVNFSAGAKTGFAAVVTGLLVAVALLFLTPLLYHLPQSTLAAVIIMAVAGLVKFEPVLHAWAVQKHDAFVSVVTFLATLVFAPNLEEGILVGVLLSLGLFLYRTMRPRFPELAMGTGGSLEDAAHAGLAVSPHVGVYGFEGPLYFGNAGYFEGKLLSLIASKPDMKAVVLDFEAVNEIDATGYEAVSEMFRKLEKAGISVFIARIRPSVSDALERAGFFESFDRRKAFRTRTPAIRAVAKAFPDADISALERPIPASGTGERAE